MGLFLGYAEGTVNWMRGSGGSNDLCDMIDTRFVNIVSFFLSFFFFFFFLCGLAVGRIQLCP